MPPGVTEVSPGGAYPGGMRNPRRTLTRLGRRPFVVVVALLVAVSSFVLGAPAAQAAPEDDAWIRITPESGPVGTVVTITGVSPGPCEDGQLIGHLDAYKWTSVIPVTWDGLAFTAEFAFPATYYDGWNHVDVPFQPGDVVDFGFECPLAPLNGAVFTVTDGSVPAAPTNVRAELSGAGSARVAWTAPPGAVTGYDLVMIADGVRLAAVDVSGTEHTFDGLSPGVIYRFEVAARNAIGTGPASSPSNAVTPPRAPYPSHAAAVDRLSDELLGRGPSSAEMLMWTEQLTTGQITPGELVAVMRRLPESVTFTDPVARLYTATYLRPADAAGLRYWVLERKDGRTIRSVAEYFRRSGEFVARYGTLTDREFVELIYQNVLGRPGEDAGVEYWTDELESGARGRGQVLLGFSEAPENRAAQAHAVDVATVVAGLLGRAATRTEMGVEVEALRSGGTVAGLADRLIASPAYAAR